MQYWLDDKFLFVDMKHKYTHAACVGDRVIACCKNEESAQSVCVELRTEKEKFIDELLCALNSDEVYGQDGYRLTGDSAKKRHIGDIRQRYKTNAEIADAIERVKASIAGVTVRELKVKQ